MPRETRLFTRVVLGWAVCVTAAHAFAPPASFGLPTSSSSSSSSSSSTTARPASVVEDLVTTTAAAPQLDDVARPAGSTCSWEVHKFGGASLATAELYRTVGDLLIKESAGRGDMGTVPTMAIVSARGGMTDLLVKVVDSALVDFDSAVTALEEAVESQIVLLRELAPPGITDAIEERFRSDGRDILSVVQSLRMLNTVPAVTMEVVTGFGEIWSAQTLHAYLLTQSVSCDWIDARGVLVVESDDSGLGEKGAASTGGVIPLYEKSMVKLSNWWNTNGRDSGLLDVDHATSAPIVVVTGFVATTIDGVPTTLKRSGSDYSATIFAKLVEAGRVTMWKNTDGVYTADPRRVPEAFSIASLKYDEAMELAYFGAQVLHPSAMEPCIENGIPVYVRNIFNPSFEGTVIQGRSSTLKDSYDLNVKNWRSKSGIVPIKGITSVDKTALVTLEGTSIGGAVVAERFMGAMADAGINVLIITQASSESSITVAVPENEGGAALAALKNAFELELSRTTVNSVSVVRGMAIVAIVGEGMAYTSGVSSTFMTALARADVNIRLIAQGSSERQIAVIVNADQTTRALRAAHMAFTLSETTASVAVLGSTGDIGSAFVSQLTQAERMLSDDVGVAMNVNIAANSDSMAFSEDSRGLDLNTLSDRLRDETAPAFDLDKITSLLNADVNPFRVVVDCTNSDTVSDYYERWLSSGINVISPSRKVAAGDMTRYKKVCEAQRQSSANWQYETSVGSALPICTTLRDLQETGDTVQRISGCVSGTMAYVLSTFDEDVPFSVAAQQAVEKRIAENDLRKDLSGFDQAQKVVILARQLGLDVGLDDVEVESLVPEDVAARSYPGTWQEQTEAQLEDLQAMDAVMLERLKTARADDRVLRYQFSIDTETGKCKCSLEAVSNKNPLFRLKNKENLVAFETARYCSSPLIVKGAAAGPDLAAAGIFGDLLRLTRAYASSQG